MNNTLTPLSGVQNLGATHTTPRLQTVSISVKPGLLHTIKTVGTALYVSACYYIDDAGNRISTAASVAMNSDAPFLVEAGTQVEFEVFDRPFNELHFAALADVETFIEIQIAYMLRVKNSSGGAGTASDLAHLQNQISELSKLVETNAQGVQTNKEAIEAIGRANFTTYGLTRIFASSDSVAAGYVESNSTKADPFLTGKVVFAVNSGETGGFYVGSQNRSAPAWTQWQTLYQEGRIRAYGNTNHVSEDFYFYEKTAGVSGKIVARMQDLDALRTQILALVGTGIPAALEYDVPATASSLQIPFDDVENGSISVSEIGGDFLTANSSGEIQIESL